ncbi:hypothetical protein N7467_010304 [Penicillium canescens]|nr:hypothetical protein N7467_010304 [Penicillium canescens]
MTADAMGLVENNPLHFNEWTKSNHPEFDGVRYPPRQIYGKYLTWLFDRATENAASQEIHLEVIHKELVAVSQFGNKFKVVDDDAKTTMVDKVVLALGNFTKCTQPDLINHSGYFSSPWPLGRLDGILPFAPVCIIGSRLSAIDAAFRLVANHHKGPIYLASRSGRLPGVQGRSSQEYKKRYGLEMIARELEGTSKSIGVFDVYDRLRSHLDGFNTPNWEAYLNEENALQQLTQNVLEAEQDKPSWRSVIDAAAPMFERYWNCITMKDRLMFIDDWNSAWYSIVHAMPYENALHLQQLLQERRIEVVKFHQIKPSQDGFSIITASRAIQTDFIVEATGLELNVSHIQSSVIKSVLSSGMLEGSPLGGFSVNQHTLESTKAKGLYVIGSLTTGVHFYTNGIDRNTAHASRIARNIVGKPLY